ncbi:DUF4410 domain-containing protein [Formicincola oecophyllae]|uniref:DUF4410 domain-containing protein n=1 Tax=Formicincola oecophyllae TaxID=2558361 RepID=A0A4Y6U9D2_9PROT|nr:DUF4410 domain-containing protein [Formicincola oecophyllae]QDH14069.1 DUF4410 domain-containing protein [Formicincola oecophyllae]
MMKVAIKGERRPAGLDGRRAYAPAPRSAPLKAARLVALGLSLAMVAGCGGADVGKNGQTAITDPNPPAPIGVAISLSPTVVLPTPARADECCKKQLKQSRKYLDAVEALQQLQNVVQQDVVEDLISADANAWPAQSVPGVRFPVPLRLTITITSFNPGSEWQRSWLGWGAGAGELTAHVTLTDSRMFIPDQPLLAFDVKAGTGVMPGVIGFPVGAEVIQAGMQTFPDPNQPEMAQNAAVAIAKRVEAWFKANGWQNTQSKAPSKAATKTTADDPTTCAWPQTNPNVAPSLPWPSVDYRPNF